jgi:hypothetical protein
MSNEMIEKIIVEGRILALILRVTYTSSGIQFFTPPEFTQQLAYMHRPAGYVIVPHVHNVVRREVEFTKEVLVIKSGKVRIDFYNDDKAYLESRILNAGDVVLLALGGHGLEMLQSSEIIEIKQGPYVGDLDKNRFEPINANYLKVVEGQ